MVDSATLIVSPSDAALVHCTIPCKRSGRGDYKGSLESGCHRGPRVRLGHIEYGVCSAQAVYEGRSGLAVGLDEPY